MQLTYTSDRLKGVAGVYYFTGTARGAFDASLGALNLTSLTKGSVDTDSIAVYFDTTWSLTDRLNLNVGARWNEDDKEATVFVAQYLGRLPPNATLFDQNNVPAGFTLLAVQTNYTNDRSFSNVSPRLGFDFQLSDDVLAYVSYSRRLQERRLRHARQRDRESGHARRLRFRDRRQLRDRHEVDAGSTTRCS